MNIAAEISNLKVIIDALLVTYPDMADDEQLRADMLEGETDIDALLAKLTNIALDAGSMADAIKLRKTDLDARKARYEAKEDAFRKLIAGVMQAANLSKFTLPDATLSVRQIAPAPIVTDPAALPDNCVKIERKPDMAAIKAALETLPNIPGVAMGNGKQSLTIRTK